MIFARISELSSISEKYRGLEKICEAVKKQHFKELDTGFVYNLDDNIRFIVQEYAPRLIENTTWEMHRKCIDVQYVDEGEEFIAAAITGDFQTVTPYEEEKDVEFFLGPDDGKLLLKAGMALIFFPGEYHRPGISTGNCDCVRKVIFKIAVDC